MTCVFEVIDPGFRCLIQDSGRVGYHHLGVTTGGAMDQESFELANTLCNNNSTNAVVEITFGGVCLTSKLDATIALTGATMSLKINGTKAEQWRAHRILAGSRLEIGLASDGVYGYLAIAGGFVMKPILGSMSCVQREHIGGHKQNGSALRQGDQLHCDPQQPNYRLAGLPSSLRPKRYGNDQLLRVILGSQQQKFDPIQKKIFFSSEYLLTPECDRMGYRLSGPKIESKCSNMFSEGTTLGSIQIPQDGQPIILMRDRQTMGGYPKLGSVLSLDIDRLSQLPQGSTVTFKMIHIEEAHNILLLEAQKRASRRLKYM